MGSHGNAVGPRLGETDHTLQQVQCHQTVLCAQETQVLVPTIMGSQRKLDLRHRFGEAGDLSL